MVIRRVGTKGQKCRRFGFTTRRVCADFRGGKKGVRGQPGKKCVRFKKKKVRICRDFA